MSAKVSLYSRPIEMEILMQTRLRTKLAASILLFFTTCGSTYAADPLPSWNEGNTKKSILRFVDEVTKEHGAKFVAPDERIATFDNDGTLWVEQPIYTQLIFALERIKELAPQHPEWKDIEPYKSVIAGDLNNVFAAGEKAIAPLLMQTHSGMTTDEFREIARKWLETAQDARFKRLHTQLVYQPMIELLSFLRSNGFKTYIVSGGGVEFVRAFSEKCYGIPPEQDIGSSAKLKFEHRDGHPVLVQLPVIDFIDEKEGKPIGIEKNIGRRPIAAFGNSDGDLEMLQWTAAGAGARFCLVVHHTDAVREYSYDRNSKVGKLDKCLDEAMQQGWTVVDIKNDWKNVFPSPLD
jgi:phosphoglycolate phosphatase-like HAD superfamily hydrolase